MLLNAIYTYVISKGLNTILNENPELFERLIQYVKYYTKINEPVEEEEDDDSIILVL